MNLSEARKILGVSKDASKDDIKKAYRSLAMKYHPDRNPDSKEAEEKFKKISLAYEIINDPRKVKQSSPFGFNGFGGGFRKKQYDPFQVGQDIHVSISITLEEAAKGVKKTMLFDRPSVCDSCDGRGLGKDKERSECPICKGKGFTTHHQKMGNGNFVMRSPCGACRGTGSYINPQDVCNKCGGKRYIKKNASVEANLPKGIRTGMTFSLEGEGGEGISGGPNGRLFIKPLVEDHKYYEFDPNSHYDLVLNYNISYYEHFYGTEIEVKSIYGNKIIVKIPPKSDVSKPIIKEGYGFPQLDQMGDNAFKGDLHIYLNVVAPDSPDEGGKAAIDKLQYEVANPIKEY